MCYSFQPFCLSRFYLFILLCQDLVSSSRASLLSQVSLLHSLPPLLGKVIENYAIIFCNVILSFGTCFSAGSKILVISLHCKNIPNVKIRHQIKVKMVWKLYLWFMFRFKSTYQSSWTFQLFQISGALAGIKNNNRSKWSVRKMFSCYNLMLLYKCSGYTTVCH